MTISWWLVLLAAALAVTSPQLLVHLSYWVEYKVKLAWLNWRMERMARRIYNRLQRDNKALGLPPLPPFSWKALEQRYKDE